MMKSSIITISLLSFLVLVPVLIHAYVVGHHVRTPLVSEIQDDQIHDNEKRIIRNPSPAELDIEAHDVNDVYLMISNCGTIGCDLRTNYYGGFFPRGTDNNYVWKTGLWFGANYDADGDSVLDKVFTQACNTLVWPSEFREGRNDQEPNDSLARVFDSTDLTDLAEWPPQFSDSLTGDPILFSDQDLVTTYTTKDKTPITGEFQLPLLVNQRSLVATSPWMINQVVFVIFEVTNWGNEILKDAWVGFAGLFAIGPVFFDDNTSVIFDWAKDTGDTVTLDVVCQWDSDFWEPDFSGDPGFVGVSYLFGPGNPDDGIDNDRDSFVDESTMNGLDDDNDGFIDEWDEEDVIGLINFSIFCYPGSPCEVYEPTSDPEGYDLLSCNTPGSWVQCLERTEPGWWRFMLSSGPFDWYPGQSHTIAIAFIFANPLGPPYELDFVGEPPRPDPNSPVLNDFVYVTEQAREYFYTLYTPLAIGNDDGYSKPRVPKSISLSQNYPNPFNPSTTIDYSVPSGESLPIQLEIYDLRGRHIRNLVNEKKQPGHYSVHWDGKDEKGQEVNSGTYLYKITVGDISTTKKMTILR
jgi:hypothetical protein